jgi:hypothetical protein
MQPSAWYPFDAGSTIGGTGTENGIILRDEEYSQGARITLERGGYAPFAITCGIYGWMFHTRFCPTEEEANAAFDAMQAELARMVSLIPVRDDPEADGRLSVLYESFEDFVRKFP